jgi:acetyl-CoA acetyltransferase
MSWAAGRAISPPTGPRGHELADAFAQVVGEGLAAVDLDPEDIETGHVGNFAGELFAGQGLLGGFFGLVHPAFDGLPTARHEAACASGSVAILAATAEIEAGRYDLACVVGIEQMRNVLARRRPRTWARPPGPVTSSRTPASCGRAPSPTSPTNMTAAMA